VPIGKTGIFAAEILLQSLFHGRTNYLVVIKFVKEAILCRSQKSVIVTSIEVTTVNKHTVKLVYPRFRFICILRQIGGGIKFLRKLVSIINLHHRVSVDVIFEPL